MGKGAALRTSLTYAMPQATSSSFGTLIWNTIWALIKYRFMD